MDTMKLIDNFAQARRLGPVSYMKWAAIRRAFERAGWRYTTAGRCAARYHALTGCTLGEAAEVFAIHPSTVKSAESGMERSTPCPRSASPPPASHVTHAIEVQR